MRALRLCRKSKIRFAEITPSCAESALGRKQGIRSVGETENRSPGNPPTWRLARTRHVRLPTRALRLGTFCARAIAPIRRDGGEIVAMPARRIPL